MPPLDRADSPLCAALARQAREQTRRPAVVSEAERLVVSFGALARRTERWAQRLDAAGVRNGDIAALATGNAAAFPELFFALRACGATVLAIDAAQQPREVASRMRARWLLHREPALGGEALSDAPDASVRFLKLDGGSDAPPNAALIKLTSGSTLEPRGACFTDAALVEGIAHIAQGMGLSPSDTVLIVIPLSHSYGFDNGVLSLAVAGTPLVLQPDVMPAALVKTLREREITFFPIVPALVSALASGDPCPLPRLRGVISASAPLSPEVARAFAARLGVHVAQFYGATECGGISFETHPADSAAAGCVGPTLPGVRIELATDGCVRVHSAANRFALWSGSLEPAPKYVETGDRACFTPEGRLKLLGRAQHVANVGGFKIDLASIEAFFRGVTGVSDAAALSVDDPTRGERVVVCVETETQSPQQLYELCRSDLSSREVPAEIRVVDRLPRTPRGKLDRTALRALVNGGRRDA